MRETTFVRTLPKTQKEEHLLIRRMQWSDPYGNTHNSIECYSGMNTSITSVS